VSQAVPSTFGRKSPVSEIVAAATREGGGDVRAIARLLSLVEDASPALREVMTAIASLGGRAQVVGLTGSPGVGKSTSTSALVQAFRAAGRRVGVLAIDPSSPFTGGALLGDRVRMQDHATDTGVFIRSLASRGHLGGLSRATPQAVRVLDAAGFDVVLVETVGVGQAEVDIAGLADTTLVLLAPGMGDGVQAAKAGILEIADVFVVNKADRDGADSTRRDLMNMLQLGLPRAAEGSWTPPVLMTVASQKLGVDEVVEAIGNHFAWMSENGVLQARRQARATDEIESIALAVLRGRMGDLRNGTLLADLATEVVTGSTDPFSAADRLIDGVTA
jgi:LAO/AO transport system kinase